MTPHECTTFDSECARCELSAHELDNDAVSGDPAELTSAERLELERKQRIAALIAEARERLTNQAGGLTKGTNP